MRSLSTVEKAIDVLFVFAEKKPHLSVTEVAAKLGLNKSSVHQVLVSLREKGLIEQEPETKHYGLSPRVVMLGKAYLQHLGLQDSILPILRTLRDTSEETVVLNMRSGDMLIHISQAEGIHQVRRVAEIGASISLHLGSAGKVVLAFLPESDIIPFIEEAKKEMTFSSSKESADFVENFKEELTRIRQKGYAMNLNEGSRGAHFMSAPVFKSNDRVIGCISISGPGNRFTSPMMRRQIGPLLKTANECSHVFGSSVVLGT